MEVETLVVRIRRRLGGRGAELGVGSVQCGNDIYDILFQFNGYRLYAYISLRPTGDRSSRYRM